METDVKLNREQTSLDYGEDIEFGDGFDDMESGQESAEETEQFLTFQLGGAVYGLNVSRVREVIEYDRVFHIPLTPEFISGVINLRGEVVPIIDLHSRFYSTTAEISKFSCIVIVEAGSEDEPLLMGILIDAIRAVTDIPKGRIEAAPGFGAKIRNDFIWGIGKEDGGFIIILNIERVLDIDEISAYDTI